jgi:hypothetical protein
MSSAAVADVYVDPAAGGWRLAEQVQACWELAIAPHWGICSLLEGDLLCRGWKLGQARYAGLFDYLAGSVKGRDGFLRIGHRRFKGVRQFGRRGVVKGVRQLTGEELLRACGS